MFDIGFSELILVFVVALLVLGPDKLPGAIRTVGLWIGRMKRSFNNIKTEIEKEVGADEVRRQLRNEAIMEKIKNTKSQFSETIDSVKKEAHSVASSVKPEGLDEIKKDIKGLSGQAKAATNSIEETVKGTEPSSKTKEQQAPASSDKAASTPIPEDTLSKKSDTPASPTNEEKQ